MELLNLKLKMLKILAAQTIIVFCIIFSHIVCVNAQPINFTLDFEEGNLRGWERTGTAFDYQPTFDDNPTARHRGQPSNYQGKYWIGTYEKYQGRYRQEPGDIQGDRPIGTLTSASFTIPQGTLSFLIGGGSSFETRVELLVQDPIEGYIRVLYASGQNTETMHRIEWNLMPYAGKTGKIRIVDESSQGWGHINVDDFRFNIIHVVKYNVILEADNTRIEEGGNLKFKAILHPPIQDVQYRFNFGDQWSDWRFEPEIQHFYSSTGIYHPFVIVRKEREIIAESKPIDIEIYRIQLPPEDRTKREPIVPIDRNQEIPLWLKSFGIILGLILVFCAGYYLSKKVDKQKKEKHMETSINIEPMKDIGTQQIESKYPLLTGFEIYLKPVLDKGKQDIEINGSLLLEERREHG